MTKRIYRNTYYEVRTPDDAYGLVGTFESSEEALAEVNRSYKSALAKGYDNRHEDWITVLNEVTREYNEEGAFLRSKHERWVMDSIQFDEYDNCYVFAY